MTPFVDRRGQQKPDHEGDAQNRRQKKCCPSKIDHRGGPPWSSPLRGRPFLGGAKVQNAENPLPNQTPQTIKDGFKN